MSTSNGTVFFSFQRINAVRSSSLPGRVSVVIKEIRAESSGMTTPISCPLNPVCSHQFLQELERLLPWSTIFFSEKRTGDGILGKSRYSLGRNLLPRGIHAGHDQVPRREFARPQRALRTKQLCDGLEQFLVNECRLIDFLQSRFARKHLVHRRFAKELMPSSRAARLISDVGRRAMIMSRMLSERSSNS